MEKKPYRIKCKATLISVDHGERGKPDPVPEVLERFKKYLQSGKTLFIEGTEQVLGQMERKVLSNLLKYAHKEKTVPLQSYEHLILENYFVGMKIAPLDSKIHSVAKKLMQGPSLLDFLKRFGMKKMEERVLFRLKIKSRVLSREFGKVSREYGVTRLRERGWVLKLRNAEKGDIIVMHPLHAYRIAPLLGIPRKKVVWLHKPDPKRIEASRMLLHWKRIRKIKELKKKARAFLIEKKRGQKKKPV